MEKKSFYSRSLPKRNLRDNYLLGKLFVGIHIYPFFAARVNKPAFHLPNQEVWI